MKKSIYSVAAAVCILLLATLACNLPNRGSNDSPAISGDNPLPGGDQPPVVAGSGLPTVTMPGGTGYIFSTGEITSGEGALRDIWWNASQFVPDRIMGMASLGIVDDLASVSQISDSTLVFGTFVGNEGEAYAVKVVRDGATVYALIRVLSFSDDMDVTFEYIYPYTGNVLP